MIVFDKGKKLVCAPSTWTKEARLDEFLFKFPEALSEALYADPMGNLLIPLGKQLWNIDVLFLRLRGGVSPETALVVCEDKRGSNRELRRKVLAQAIDYASLITEMDIDEFTTKVKAAFAEKSVQDVVNRLKCKEDSSLDELDAAQKFVEAAISAKEAGRIEVVICGDDIPSDLIRMTHWLNRLVEKRGVHPLVSTCQVHPIDDGAEGLVGLAATLAEINEVDAESLNPEEQERLRKNAQALRALPMFQVSIAEVKSLGADRIAVQATMPPDPKRLRSDSIRSVDEWEASVPSPAMRTLYQSLKEALGPRAHWKPGGLTGSQLCLWFDIEGLDKQAALLRLKKDRANLIFPQRPAEFESCRDWARQQVVSLGAGPLDAAQPTFLPQRVAELANDNGAPLVRYLNEYIAKIDKAVGFDD